MSTQSEVSNLTTAGEKAGKLSLSRAARRIEQPKLRQLHAIADGRKTLSFALGMPAHDLFPAQALAECSHELLLTRAKALQYGLPSAALKEQIVTLMAQRGVTCRSEQIFLTTGAQQGLNLVPRLLLDPGGQVLVEEIVYEGFQAVLKGFEPELLSVPTCGETGPDLDAVEAFLTDGARPALMYVITDGHNPLGTSLSLEKRRRLVELARRFEVPILEDDAYGFLSYEQEPPPPLRSMEEDWVLYLGSFSKIIAPSLRVGWLVVPEQVVTRLSALKHVIDTDTSGLSQHIISKFLETGALPDHVQRLRREYKRRRDTMHGALDQHFPDTVRWNRPGSGLFVWLELPRNVDAEEILGDAVESEAVVFSPGRIFALGGGRHADHCIRLSFATCTCEEIEEGVTRLSRVVKRYLG
ncbi:MAG: PLP-dependent aminotransferase family protein [bacterium]|nr:PLP-dependent aminotransferase family protein [bacterium]